MHQHCELLTLFGDMTTVTSATTTTVCSVMSTLLDALNEPFGAIKEDFLARSEHLGGSVSRNDTRQSVLASNNSPLKRKKTTKIRRISRSLTSASRAPTLTETYRVISVLQVR